MSVVLERESVRLSHQKRLDLLKTPLERNKLGQFATPPALALDIATFVRKELKRIGGPFRFLDPAIGTGSFFAAFLQAFPESQTDYACGIELDKAFADTAEQLWRPQGLHVVSGDFTRQQIPEDSDKFNVILTNPPYVRHHHLRTEDKERLGELARSITGIKLSGLAGLYCYFLLIAHGWLADNGLAAWLIPSEFMDVNYGNEIKRYLTEKVSLLYVHRFCPSDVQFDDALVSSTVVIFQKRPPEPGHVCQFSFGGALSNPAKSEPIELGRLLETQKWTSLSTFEHNGRKRRNKTVLLGELFTVRRGLATGNNNFFILPKSDLRQFGIPLCCVRPILPSPRHLPQVVIESDQDGWPIIDKPLALIDCNLSEEEIRNQYPKFWQYLEQGIRDGVDKTYLTSRRTPWYSQEKRDAPPFLCTYMGRNREKPFRFIWNRSRATAANAFLLLYPKEAFSLAIAKDPTLHEKVFELLRTIHADEFIGEGRVYGGGLYKMEPSEFMRLPADDICKLIPKSVFSSAKQTTMWNA
jgi:adenine-specific DNA-methyltransferase